MSATGESMGPSSNTTSPSPIPESEEKSRTCKGCLYYSSYLRDARKNPRCVGLARPEQRVYSATIFSDYERSASKEALELTDFKYACVGYSIHKEATGNHGPLEGRELPLCFGIEFLADMANKRGREADSPSPLEELEQDDGSSIMQRPPSAVRQPSTVGGGMTGDEFASRFIRCAGLVASAVVKNVSHIATSIKTGYDDLVHDKRRPK